MKRLAFVALAVVAACGWNASTMNPESKEYPCGTRGIVCSGEYPHAMCCWQGDSCGGIDPACPVGYCCWVGDDDEELKLGASGTHIHMRPQRP